jgi:hypothetical protein
MGKNKDVYFLKDSFCCIFISVFSVALQSDFLVHLARCFQQDLPKMAYSIIFCLIHILSKLQFLKLGSELVLLHEIILFYSL